MQRHLKSLLAAAALATVIMSPASAAEIELTYASPYSTAHPYGAADTEWMERIQQQSGGRVAITAYWGKTLITSREGVNEVVAGIADMAYITPIYATSGFDLLRKTPAFFYGYSNPDQVLKTFLSLWEKYPQFSAELEGVHVLGYNVGTPMHIMLRSKPINTLDDLKGLRIRSANDYISALSMLGAEGVAMPMGDTYPALQKGVLDGVIAPYEALKSLSFAEVVKFYSEIPHSRGAYPSRAMNQGVWDGLPADIQKIFTDNVEWLTKRNLELSMGAEEAGKAYGVSNGVQFNTPGEDVQKAYAATFIEGAKSVAAELDAAGLPGTAILADVRAGITP